MNIQKSLAVVHTAGKAKGVFCIVNHLQPANALHTPHWCNNPTKNDTPRFLLSLHLADATIIHAYNQQQLGLKGAHGKVHIPSKGILPQTERNPKLLIYPQQ